VEFIRALRMQLLEMTAKLTWIERQDVTPRNARAYAMRVEAAALRRDIQEAQFLIDRLVRRYLGRSLPGRGKT
jgi:hypothetical protein